MKQSSAGGEINRGGERQPPGGRGAAPARGVAVLVEARLEHASALLEPADDLLVGVRGREAVQPAEVVVVVPRLVDGHDHRQVVLTPELEVLVATAGGDVDDAGALVERDVLPRDYAVLDARRRRQLVE